MYLVSVLLYFFLSFFVFVYEKLYRYIVNAVVCLEYSVSFLSEFHEVKCPDEMGWVAGCGRCACDDLKELPPT